MLSYQHAFHAGNFADVLKHATLMHTLTYLIQKKNPLFYLETHAGRGLYDLSAPQSLKTAESKSGIEILMTHQEQLDPCFSDYLDVIKQLNPDNKLTLYPGSPLLALETLRSQDRAYLCELHPTEFKALDKLPRQNKRVHIKHTDGLKQLESLLPPPERRGLIFIDPSYEIKSDYQTIPKQLKKAHQRFETGCYVVWYPLIDKKYHTQLLRGFDAIETSKKLRVELYNASPLKSGMTGCGLFIINPPFVLEKALKTLLPTLTNLFNKGRSSFLLDATIQ